jgi:hypothetical protein
MLSVCLYVYPHPQILNGWTNLYVVQLGTCIMAPEPISTAYFINLSVYLLSLPGNGWVNNVTAATNIHETIEELLDVSFSMRSVSHQRKVDD